jgi:hypothetical protein
MSEELMKIIQEMGMTEKMAIAVLEKQKELLTEDYMTFEEFDQLIKQLIEEHDNTRTKLYLYERKGLTPKIQSSKSSKMKVGQRHVYNYVIAYYLINELRLSMDDVLMVKDKIIQDQNNVIELIDVWQKLIRSDLKSKDKTFRALAMIAKANKIIFGQDED